MRSRLSGPLVLCVSFLFAYSTFGQKPADSPAAFKPARLSQNELNMVAEKLASSGLRDYTYRLYTPGAKQAVTLDAPKSVRGLFLMRNPEFMRPLSKGFYDDLQGDLVYFGRLRNTPRKQDTSYSLTLGLGGEAVVSLDFDGDGIVDGMIGRRMTGELWSLRDELSNESRRSFWGCVDASLGRSGSGGGRARTGPPRREGVDASLGRSELGVAGDCGTDEGPSGPSGAGRLGRSRDSVRSDWEEFNDALSAPDCSSPNIGESVRDPSAAPPPEVAPPPPLEQQEADARKEAGTLRTQAAEERRKGHLDYANALELEAHAAEEEADALRDLRTARTAEDANKARERIISTGEQHLAALGIVNRERRRAYPPPSGPRSGSGTHKTPGPGEGEDPRCKGIRTDTKQGLLFRNRWFCSGRDFLTCIERANNAIKDFTHGECRTRTGPDDAQRVVCDKTEDPLATTEPTSDPPPGPADGPAIPAGPRTPRVGFGYVGTTPMGAVLVILCRADGGTCGGWEGMKTKSKLANPKQ